jgi:processive 1,2-diacylglycerol beta-glucosyltransferase
MRVMIFHANAGHGHRRVAEIAESGFIHRGLSQLEVTIEDALDHARGFFRRHYSGLYFNSVKNTPGLWGWCYETSDRPGPARLVRPLRRWGNAWAGSKLLAHVLQEKPDAVVCTHFFSAEVFAAARRSGKLNAKLITVITDFLPHEFWINEGTDYYWVMGDETRQEMVKRGVPAEKIIAGGIPVDRAFLPNGRKSDLLKQWDFEANRLTLLLTSGSFGLGPTAEILEELKQFSAQVQCFVVCGNNRDLEKDLHVASWPYPVRVFGFIDFMADLMEASDLLIAKPGGATTTESLVKEIPMIVLKPIPGQESRNARILKERNCSFFMEEPGDIRVLLNTVFKQPSLLDEKRRAMRSFAKPHATEDLVSFVLQLAQPASGPVRPS